MAPFRRGRSAQPQTISGGKFAAEEEHDGSRTESAWESRRKRNDARSSGKGRRGGVEQQPTSQPTQRRRSTEKLPEDDYDPYDSDPGESYRDHCMRLKGVNSKSCLAIPQFLKINRVIMPEQSSEATSPPSPMASEADEFGHAPPSLPRDLSRVRYSLRTSIGDGSEKQPTGPSVMERRPLRPNNIHINVSYWSDTGARNYMEDR
jgi:hypothetical protein